MVKTYKSYKAMSSKTALFDLACKMYRLIHGHYVQGLIVDKKRLIYIPIAKCGTTSFNSFLAGKYFGIHSKNGIHSVLDLDWIKNGRGYPGYFKFCFVRNPHKRLISAYLNKISSNGNLNNGWFTGGVYNGLHNYNKLPFFPNFYAGMSFREFAIAVSKIPDRFSDPHFKSQSQFITDSRGRFFVDFIGNFENLKDELSRLTKESGIDFLDLPHLMKNTTYDYSSYYDRELFLLIEKRYYRDYECFPFIADNFL